MTSLIRPVLATLAVASIAIPVAACGADSSEPATAGTTTEQAPSAAASDTAAAVSEGVDDATAQTDENQRIADSYAKVAPKPLAKICGNVGLLGESTVERMLAKQLGAQIIRQGGSPSEVADLLLDRC